MPAGYLLTALSLYGRYRPNEHDYRRAIKVLDKGLELVGSCDDLLAAKQKVQEEIRQGVCFALSDTLAKKQSFECITSRNHAECCFLGGHEHPHSYEPSLPKLAVYAILQSIVVARFGSFTTTKPKEYVCPDKKVLRASWKPY